MNQLRVGIVGCGRMGKERARSSAACGACVDSVYDSDLERSEMLAAQYPGCSVVRSTEEVLGRNPSALFICVPPSSRGPIELAAIERSIPFLVEKPIGVNAEQLSTVRSKLRTSNLVHAVGYQNRCRTAVQHARRVLGATTVLAVSAFWAGRKYQVPWWLREEDSGGPLNEQATHLIDLCRYLCGEISDVSGFIGSAASEADEPLSAALALRFEEGAFGSLFYSCEASDKQIAIRFVTTAGGLELSSWDLMMTQNTIDSSGLSTGAEDVFVIETQHFLHAVASGDPRAVHCTFEDAWRTQCAVDRIRACDRTQVTS